MPSSHHPVLRPLIIKKGAENSLSPNTKIPPARRFYASLCVKSIVLQQYLPPLESRTAPGYHFKRAPYIWERDRQKGPYCRTFFGRKSHSHYRKLQPLYRKLFPRSRKFKLHAANDFQDAASCGSLWPQVAACRILRTLSRRLWPLCRNFFH